MDGNVYLAITSLSIGITLCFGLCFLFLYIPESSFLRSYRIARKIVAYAYLVLSVLYMLEIVANSQCTNNLLVQAIRLVVGSFQALLFTYTFICLINIHYVTRKRLLREIVPLGILVMAVSAALFSGNNLLFKFIYFLYLFYYLYLLVHFLIIFLKEYRACAQRADNYFSEKETQRFSWIYFSFFGMFTIGVALLLLLIFTAGSSYYSFFTLFFVVFYSYFGIKFIEYAFRYQRMELFAEVEIADKTPIVTDVDKNAQFQLIGEAIGVWVREEKYLQQGLTIETLATELNTNRTYLSNYINQIEKQTFRCWINHLKVDKAKTLLQSFPDMSVADVAVMSGYSDNSNFNKQFVKNTGTSPKIWRKNQLKRDS